MSVSDVMMTPVGASMINAVTQTGMDFVRKRLFRTPGSTATGATFNYAGPTNYVQRRNVSTGRRSRRPKANVRQAHKLLAATTTSCIMRWQRLINYEKYRPAQDLPATVTPENQFNLPIDHAHWTNAAGSHEFTVYPVYLFDVNSINMVDPNTTTKSATPMYRLYIQETGTNAGQLQWVAITGQDPTGVAGGTSWHAEDIRGADSSIGLPAPGYKSILSWSDVRLALYGATDTTTKFQVSWVQFKDSTYNPETPIALLDADAKARRNTNYYNLLKSLIFHPMDHATSDTRKEWITVLGSKTFVVGPTTASVDTSPTTQSNCVYRCFKRFNRMCSWRWDLKDTTGGSAVKISPEADQLDAPRYQQMTGADCSPYAHPKARVYLMITAQSFKRNDVTLNTAGDLGGSSPNYTVASGYNIGSTPTFDIMVRNKWLYDY